MAASLDSVEKIWEELSSCLTPLSASASPQHDSAAGEVQQQTSLSKRWRWLQDGPQSSSTATRRPPSAAATFLPWVYLRLCQFLLSRAYIRFHTIVTAYYFGFRAYTIYDSKSFTPALSVLLLLWSTCIEVVIIRNVVSTFHIFFHGTEERHFHHWEAAGVLEVWEISHRFIENHVNDVVVGTLGPNNNNNNATQSAGTLGRSAIKRDKVVPVEQSEDEIAASQSHRGLAGGGETTRRPDGPTTVKPTAPYLRLMAVVTSLQHSQSKQLQYLRLSSLLTLPLILAINIGAMVSYFSSDVSVDRIYELYGFAIACLNVVNWTPLIVGLFTWVIYIQHLQDVTRAFCLAIQSKKRVLPLSQLTSSEPDRRQRPPADHDDGRVLTTATGQERAVDEYLFVQAVIRMSGELWSTFYVVLCACLIFAFSNLAYFLYRFGRHPWFDAPTSLLAFTAAGGALVVSILLPAQLNASCDEISGLFRRSADWDYASIGDRTWWLAYLESNPLHYCVFGFPITTRWLVTTISCVISLIGGAIIQRFAS